MTPSYPFTRRQALAAALVLLLVLALGGRWLMRPPSSTDTLAVEPIVPAATSVVTTQPGAPGEVVVHVVGAVVSPGLYRLDEGSRIADAVSLAGGATRKADLSAVNLAAPLVDGTQVVVPRRGEQVSAPAGADSGATSEESAPGGPIHLNTATSEQLETIPGVGPVTAQRIIDFREQNGPFRSVDELDAVSGIGPKRLEELRGLVAP
ncbi:MAG TPA: helix-hairpin-helix domain-containing protein [Gaiellaceae bacterium]|nr:helix-hairpin-helix domain-containing protein [Gaiellaceae bacterium]